MKGGIVMFGWRRDSSNILLSLLYQSSAYQPPSAIMYQHQPKAANNRINTAM